MKSNAPQGKLFWVMLALGWAVMLFGVRGLVLQAPRTHPGNFSLWFIGSALVHDALIAPLVFLVAVILVRVVPPRLRRYLQTALILSAAAVVVAFPMIAGPGKPSNPSALPRDYPAGLLTVLAIVWGATGLLFAFRVLAVRFRHD